MSGTTPPSGPAAKKLGERAHNSFKQTEYQRLAGIAVALVYHLRKSTPDRRQRYPFEKTRLQATQWSKKKATGQ